MRRTAWLAITIAPLLLLLGASACGPEPPDMPLLDAIHLERVDIIRAHMEAGTDPDETFIPPDYPFEGASALHLAILKENEQIVRILIDNGASIDIRARDWAGGSPLEWALFFGVKDMGVLLVELGADVNAKNRFGTTPLDAATADNPFISDEDRDEFNANRAFLADYVKTKGGESGF